MTQQTSTQPDHSKAYGHNAVEPVECYYAPLLYPTIESDTRRASHCYRKSDGVWTCRNCG